MRILFLFFAILISFQISAQNLSGKWTGFLDQTEVAKGREGYASHWKSGLWKEGVPTCYLELDLKQQSNKISGKAFCTVYLKGDYNATFELEGKFENNKLFYKTTKKLDENILEGYYSGFCFNKVKLAYSEQDSFAFLEGKWTGWTLANGKCAAGIVKLKKKIKRNKNIIVDEYDSREVLIKEELNSKDKGIVIELWDDNREDGDSISLKVNDKWILRNTELLNDKKVVKVQLEKKENIITIYAENLGDIPPNTAALNIKYNGTNRKIILKSNMWTSEAIKINLE